MTRIANATYPMKLAALIKLAAEAGHPFPCAICGKPIMPGQRFAFDHGWAVGRGGPNRIEDIFPVHDEKSADSDFNCHTRKTAHPRGPHTAIGGDTFEAAKTKRLVAAASPGPATPSRSWRSRPLRGGAKLQSRPNAWPAKGSRPMRSKPMGAR